MGAKLVKVNGKGGRGGDVYLFWCPGCDNPHPFEVPAWEWNGSMESPTFSPSLLVNQSHPESRCHSFVREGRIEFLSDCHHQMAGKTIEIPDWGSWEGPAQ